MMKAVRLIGVCLALGGCGGAINVQHVTRTDMPLTGVPWNLGMTQYKIAITRQITDCTNGPKASVTVATTAAKTLDDQQRYLLDASGVWATSDITSFLAADGTSTGLNAQSQDATTTVITNIAALVGQVAAAVAVGGKEAPTGKGPVPICSKQVTDALAVLNPPHRPALKDLVDADTAAVNAATAQLTALTTQVANDPSYKHALAAAIGAQAKAQKKLTDDQAQLNKQLKKVSDVQNVVWPPQADQFSTMKPYALPQSVLAKWVTFKAPIGTVLTGDEHLIDFDVYLALYTGAPDQTWHKPKSSPAGDVSVGVPVRLPRIGRLLACTAQACKPDLAADWVASDQQQLALSPDQPVLQLGQMYNVRVTGGMFKSENAVIALDTNGIPTSIEVAEKAAAAAVAAGAATSAATQIAGIPAQVAAARLSVAQSEASLATARNTLAAAQAASQTAGPTAAATAQAGLLNAQASLATAQANAQVAGPIGIAAAQTALINAQNALNAAQANEAATPQNNVLAAQTSSINAQATLINAQVALAKAQAMLTAVPAQ